MIKFIKLIISIAALYSIVNTAWNWWDARQDSKQTAACLEDTAKAMDVYSAAYMDWYDAFTTAVDPDATSFDELLPLMADFRENIDETEPPNCAFSEETLEEFELPGELPTSEWVHLLASAPRLRQAMRTFIDTTNECILHSETDICDRANAENDAILAVMTRWDELMTKGQLYFDE
jgi:hypothetical protein